MQSIDFQDRTSLADAVEALKNAEKAVALTGAGISVACGIPDFRSPGGLWTQFAPDEYATLEVFRRDPAKAWQLYRALGRTLVGKNASRAHLGLAGMERTKLIRGVITQNVDNLHQRAGNTVVYEIHGDHLHLQCLDCDAVVPVCDEHYLCQSVPECSRCKFPLKPNVVLFGEPVRQMNEIEAFVSDCDLLMVIGTSAQVYPAAGIPHAVKQRGGIIMEFNRQAVLGLDHFSGVGTMTDYLFRGDVEDMLPLFCDAAGVRI